MRGAEHEKINAERRRQVEDRHCGIVADRKHGGHCDPLFLPELEHERHDGRGMFILLPAGASRQARAPGKHHRDLLHIKHAEHCLAKLRLLERVSQHRRDAADSDHDFLAFLQLGPQHGDFFRINDIRHLARDGDRFQSLPFLRVSPQPQTGHQHDDHKKEGLVFFMCERQLDADQDEKGQPEEESFPDFQLEFAIETATAQVHRNRPHNADRVKAGQHLEIGGNDQDDDRQGDREDERNDRHAVAVELCELTWHLAVACHHVKHADHGHHRGVGGADQQKEKDNPDHDGERVAEPRPDAQVAEILGDQVQHVGLVIHHPLLQLMRDREHRPAEKRGAEDNLYGNRPNGFRGFPGNIRLVRWTPGIELEHARHVGDCFHAAQGEDRSDKLFPDRPGSRVQRGEMRKGQIRGAHGNQHQDNHNHRHAQDYRKAAAVFRTVKIQTAHDQQRHDR